jgi:hypothetical protein
MSRQTFSRSYLKSLPEDRKQKEIDSLIKEYVDDIKNKAALGETTYWFPLNAMINTDDNFVNARNHGNIATQITIGDLVVGFEERFPDCKVSYQENWTERIGSMRYLKKGILLDWT